MVASTRCQRRWYCSSLFALLLTTQICQNFSTAEMTLEQALSLVSGDQPANEATEMSWTPTPNSEGMESMPTTAPTAKETTPTPAPTSVSQGWMPTIDSKASPTDKPLEVQLYDPVLATESSNTQPTTNRDQNAISDSFDKKEALAIPKESRDESEIQPTFFRSSGAKISASSSDNAPEVGCNSSKEVGCGSAAFTHRQKESGNSSSSSSSSHSGSYEDGDAVHFPNSGGIREQQTSVVLAVVALSIVTSLVFGC